MARLTSRNNRGFIDRDDGKGWVELSPSDYAREQIYQNEIVNRSTYDRFMPAVGKYVSDAASGISQLLGGENNKIEQQQKRADLQQQYQPQQDYGGFAESAGEFAAPMATAVIPGGLLAQSGIGTVQGMVENPDNPMTGALWGLGGTVAGEYLGDAVGRIGRNLHNKRLELSPDPYLAGVVQEAEEMGFQFTPGQRSGDPARIRMEKQLAKTPRFAHLDMQRFLDNQARLNNLAAETLGMPQTGRVTPQMRGAAKDEVKAAFDAIATDSAPITILGREFIDAAQEIIDTDLGAEWFEKMLNKFPDSFAENKPMTGEQFMQLRNWVAEQARKSPNIKSGIADELQPIMRVLDDSLQAANQGTPLFDRVGRARTQWKSLLVVEDALRGAEQSAQGMITPHSAYQALKKYDKGGIFRGRSRDPFDRAVNALTVIGDTKAPIPPSQDPGRGVMQMLSDLLVEGPAAEAYMRGDNIGEILMGAMRRGDAVPGAGRAGIGLERGLMEQEEEYPQ